MLRSHLMDIKLMRRLPWLLALVYQVVKVLNDELNLVKS